MKRPLMLLTMFLFALPCQGLARQGTPLVPDRDRSKLAELFSDYFLAKKQLDYKAIGKTYETLVKDLDKRASKAKVDTLLVSPADMRSVFGFAIDPPKSIKKGVIRENSGSQNLRNGTFKYRYLLRPPKDYKDKESFPIVVFLHGAIEDPEKIDKEVEEAIKAAYPADMLDQTFVLAPLLTSGSADEGPVVTDWMSIEGRMSAFFSLLEVQTGYSINQLRVFIDGSREGALASIQYAAAYPGSFCGAILRRMVGSPGEATLANAQHVALLMIAPKSGDSADLMTQFADTAKANQINSVSVVQTDFAEWDAPDDAALGAIAKFIAETKKQVAPDKIQFTTTSDEYTNAYWLHLIIFDVSADKPITVKAEIDRATNEITVETPSQVGLFRVYVNDDLVDMGKTIKVIYKITGGEDADAKTVVGFEGSIDRSLDRALTIWFDGRSGNRGEVYTNWIEVEVPRG